MSSRTTCLVTLHGIGFEQPPQPELNIPGYADQLHEHLSKYLGIMLSDDPHRAHERKQPGQSGAIYVQSRWLTPAGTASRQEGLKRLGNWSKDMRRVETEQAPLVANDSCISHVALVYSDLEPKEPEVGPALVTSAMSLLSLSSYAHVAGLMHMVMTDILAMVRHHTAPSDDRPSSLRPRVAHSSRSHQHLKHQEQVESQQPSGLITTLRTLEDDVACYVCHNEEREQVRSFVAEALLRLAFRDDVDAIVLNTHSNGTVVALDVIRQLPPFAAAKIKAFITAGSPLRKYVNLLHWGQQIECSRPIPSWYNFWDECDPVADPLEPPITWHRGDKLASPYDPKLFRFIDPNSGTPSNIEVADIKVDNIHNSTGGGLQAHNYWDNEEQFVKQFADIVRKLVGKRLATAA